MALTAAQIERREANREYWRKREREQRELYMLEEAEQEKELRRIYAEMEEWCTAEVERFYGKYASAEGIDITEAKRRVAKEDVEAFEAQAKKYVEEKDFSPQANAEMRLYNATMRINRLELLKAQIGLHTVGGFDEIQAYYEEKITDRTMDELERQAGLLGRPIKEQDVVKRAKNIVSASFYNATFSERIWSHMDNLRQSIATELQKGLIAGVGSREMARRIKEYSYYKSLSDAHRLMVTELRRVQTDVALDSYKAQGIEQYEFMAVNPNACEICKDMDGNIYNVNDLEAGVNAPPIHPRCHCTTAPYLNEYDYEAWLSWLEQGGTTEQWDAMTEDERNDFFLSLNRRQDAPAPVVQSSEGFTPAKSIKEAEEYANSLGIEAHYKGVSLETANAMNESFKRGIDYCDRIRQRMQMVGSGQTGNKLLKQAITDYYMTHSAERLRRRGYSDEQIERWAKSMASKSVGRIPSNTYAFARNVPSFPSFSGIFVNNTWADYNKMLKAVREDVKSGFHPVGCDTVKAIFDHEVAHQLDYALDLRNDSDIVNLWNSLSRAEISSGLSRYATEDIQEFIAEGYSEYLNNPQPREISRQIGEAIERRVRR